MKKSRICCILNYPSHYRSRIYQLMEQELDCDFFFGDVDIKTIRKLDYSVFRKKITDLHTRKLGPFNWISGAWPLIFKNYDKYVLTGYPYCLSDWLILLLACLLRKKTYLWTHGWYGDETKSRVFFKKLFFGFSSGLFLYGDYAKDLMIAAGFRQEKLHVIYNSLDYDKQLVVRKKLKPTSVYRDHFGNDDPVLIFTGRLNKSKKIEHLINVHQLLSEEIQFNVLLLGDGPEIESLKVKVKNFQLEKQYWFYGACYDEGVIGEFYYNAAVCVSPGNVGLTAMHSMMYGCPVITHSSFPKQMPEFEIIQKSITGAFFEYNNVVSLSKTIRFWLKEHSEKDNSLRTECFKMMDEKYNPSYQIEVFKSVLL